MANFHYDVLVVGSGVAGSTAALSLAPLRVGLITRGRVQSDCSSVRAQGGIAAAIGIKDHARLHVEDTVNAAAGLTDVFTIYEIINRAIHAVSYLEHNGVQFRKGDKGYSCAREGGHRTARVLHGDSGDSFGEALMPPLWQAVESANHIDILEGCEVTDLIIGRGGMVNGVQTKWGIVRAPQVILATGGAGGLYQTTTNPSGNMGRAMAMAWRAGAELADIEFAQFHPTALVHETCGEKTPLISEAVRGAGARLCTEEGIYFMESLHPLADLAPRDIVARAMGDQMAKGHRVYLDCRGLDIAEFKTLKKTVERCGLNPKTDLLPVAPAAHYHMGGVKADATGKTNVAGLFVIGEAASTGLHGANRLASNSLLEGVVTGRLCAEYIRKSTAPQTDLRRLPAPRASDDRGTLICGNERKRVLNAIRRAMTENVGLVRHAEGLGDAIACFEDISRHYAGLDAEITDAAWVATLIAKAALNRKESRGGHTRADYPYTDPSLNCRQVLKRSGDLAFAKDNIHHAQTDLKRIKQEVYQ
tara:strand:- start:479 stop:2074 length:1596 start_codon:yes stop_codon:yes gene_type:complete